VFCGTVNHGTYLARHHRQSALLAGADRARGDRQARRRSRSDLGRGDARFTEGTRWWVEEGERELFSLEQELRYVGDAYEEKIRVWAMEQDRIHHGAGLRGLPEARGLEVVRAEQTRSRRSAGNARLGKDRSRLNFSHGTLKKNFMAKLLGGGSTSRGLAGLDGAAQAGMILAQVWQLDRDGAQILVARFTAPTVPCACRAPCCGGERETKAWSEAIDHLTARVLELGLTGTISHYRLRRALVKRYFGIRPSLVQIANSCGVNRDTASDYNRRVHDHLHKADMAAFNRVELRLREAGIVAS
jgi:hypothetical protein